LLPHIPRVSPIVSELTLTQETILILKMTCRAALVAALATTALASLAIRANARELRMGLITPPSHVWAKVASRIAEKLPEATGGNLTLSVFPAGQLGVEHEMF
jgi:TRAP-type transport system periplasmic protein